ncbi:hypothetical protein C2869_00340 [Saccharobesus litoralis]|uniref:Uncharacterized protein n=1 Tax=Saccharobesus litoralis TaxID=2172099 RepID=A0A2S0VLA4_9ALTE|nr:GGDEF domain-containing phosphodiesterase [Saccharobesus litoralis]AWB64981.1 hypothetical protein C2869_00340 [Saccharobesus litoralis]
MEKLTHSIKARTQTVFAIVVVAGLILSYIVFWSASQVKKTTQELVDKQIPVYQLVAQFSANLVEQERLLYEYYATDDPYLYLANNWQNNFTSQSEKNKKLLQDLKQHFVHNNTEINHLYTSLTQIAHEANALHDNMASTQTDWDLARESLSKIAELRINTLPSLDKLSNEIRQAVAQAYTQNETKLDTSLITVLSYSFFILIVAFVMARILSRYFVASAQGKRLSLFPIANPNPVISLSRDLKITYHNPATDDLLEQIQTQHPASLLPVNYQNKLTCLMAEQCTYRQVEYQVANMTLLADIHWHKDEQEFDIYIQNITQQVLAKQRLEYQAYHDRASGLNNNYKLLEVLQELVDSQVEFALGMIEVRHFNQLIAGQGMEASLALVKSFAQRLNTAVAKCNCEHQLYHVSQNVFSVLVMGTHDAGYLAHLCKQIEEQVEAPIETDFGELKIELDFGFCQYPNHGHDKHALLKHVRAALDEAIQKPHSTFVFYTDRLGEQLEYRLKLQRDLDKAIEDHNLQLNFQPQFDIQARRIIGMETLIRWNNHGNWVSPADFIPLAEQTGQIIDLGRWILMEACLFCSQLFDKGYRDLVVAINISPRQFQHPDFITSVKQAINLAEIPASSIELEITEGVILGNEQDTIHALQTLKDFGVMLSIDDFGTGYSSLSYLKQFPLDKLKIDQAFIRQLEQNEQDQAIVRTIIDLGQNLNLTLIAEGVEKSEQLTLLQQMGCHEIQGYYFSRPLPADHLLQFLQQNNIQSA